MLLGAVGLFLWIRERGGRLFAPASSGPLFGSGGGEAHAADALPHVLLALAVILVASWLTGALFRRLGQPPVIGEVVAGILLGPSLLGRVAPEVMAQIFPTFVVPFLGILAQVGVILFMFMVGLHLDPAELRKGTHATVAISHASIVVPFSFGALLALWLYPLLSTSDVPFTAFALFLGVSMSVTAFPVLARILTDRGIEKTRLGVIALTCAAVDDVTAWCLLAFVVSIVNAEPGAALVTASLTVGYILVMFAVVRPVLVRLVRSRESEGLTQGAMSLALLLLLVSSLTTEAIGIHALFGAFLLGAVVPHDGRIVAELTERLKGLVALLLPAFFAFTGLRTQIGLVSGVRAWLLCGAIILVASLGKFGGSAVAARLTGLNWRDSASLGILMNTRGLMELIVLNIGLDLRVLSPTLFAMLVLMALVTTVATTPILQLLQRGSVEEIDSGIALAGK